jgi:hypothetical protein
MWSKNSFIIRIAVEPSVYLDSKIPISEHPNQQLLDKGAWPLPKKRINFNDDYKIIAILYLIIPQSKEDKMGAAYSTREK